MLKKNFYIGVFVVLFSSISNAQFQMGQHDLCFLNKDPDLAKFGFWGELGAREGVCQGIAGLSKIFRENVVFRPNLAKESSNIHRVFQAFKTYRTRPAEKIVIKGYTGLNELCRDYRDVFLRQSIILNRDIAVYDILPLYPEFRFYKDSPIFSIFQQLQIDQTIRRQVQLLKSGRYPMILIYSHVMLVVDIKWAFGAYFYTYYDSNHRDLQTWIISYGDDGLPLLGQRMLWDITLNN